VDIIKHPNITKDDLHTENKKCWDNFYSLRESFSRTRRGNAKSWPLAGKLAYLVTCILFRRAYAGYGMAADAVRRTEMKVGTRLMIRGVVGFYNLFFRRMSLRKTGLTLATNPKPRALV
jgi:hypothetical protein